MTTTESTRAGPSSFELLVTCNPPIFESLLAQIPTESILNLYHTSSYLQQFLRTSPTSWRYLSWRIYQPVVAPAQGQAGATTTVTRQSTSYPLDRLMFYVINPFSTRLVNLELDNTSVSGGVLSQTVLVQRRDTLQHLSVRGCKNVSLKYHINPWLQMHALAKEIPDNARPPDFAHLALKSLYTYRCRHHRRRPYLPSSLSRKESDSEPTHELVNICHKLGIWTDTAWCTTPGPRCFRRRGYVTMRLPQDPREVWVVFDRLWRSRNWLGPIEQAAAETAAEPSRKRKRDVRVWEFDEHAMNGEPLGATGQGKAVPTHLRKSHLQFVEKVSCDNCAAPILERCEQCSVMMHCSGCRKTLCSSCAFDRPYLRNANATEEEKQKFWWAPGSAVSPCSMQDQDPSTTAPNPGPITNTALVLPNIRFRWCCTEPVFSGGGGITFGIVASRETDRLRAAPLPKNQGWEDAEFRTHVSTEVDHDSAVEEPAFPAPAGRVTIVENVFRAHELLSRNEHTGNSLPRILCDECFTMDQWKIRCKACAVSICLKHDVCDRLKVRVCGYKDLNLEKQRYTSRQKALRWLQRLMSEEDDASLLPNLRRMRMSLLKAASMSRVASNGCTSSPLNLTSRTFVEEIVNIAPNDFTNADLTALVAEVDSFLDNLTRTSIDMEPHPRPLSRGSNSTGPPSRSSSPTPSINSQSTNPEPCVGSEDAVPTGSSLFKWTGCQSFFCPTIRSAGDHRRRCVATIRTCTECKVNVCSECVSTMEPPCPCQGCRQAQSPLLESDGPSTTSTPGDASQFFFCPNCRWDRMQSGKCRIHSRAFLSAKLQAVKRRKTRTRQRKPVEARSTGQNSGEVVNGPSDEAVEGLAEFFSQLNAQVPSSSQPPTNSNITSNASLDIDHEDEDPNIQQLEDMGTLARDLIRRIQRLREHFRPESDAGSGERGLSDIRVGQVDGANVVDIHQGQNLGSFSAQRGTIVDAEMLIHDGEGDGEDESQLLRTSEERERDHD